MVVYVGIERIWSIICSTCSRTSC